MNELIPNLGLYAVYVFFARSHFCCMLTQLKVDKNQPSRPWFCLFRDFQVTVISIHNLNSYNSPLKWIGRQYRLFCCIYSNRGASGYFCLASPSSCFWKIWDFLWQSVIKTSPDRRKFGLRSGSSDWPLLKYLNSRFLPKITNFHGSSAFFIVKFFRIQSTRWVIDIHGIRAA